MTKNCKKLQSILKKNGKILHNYQNLTKNKEKLKRGGYEKMYKRVKIPKIKDFKPFFA